MGHCFSRPKTEGDEEKVDYVPSTHSEEEPQSGSGSSGMSTVTTEDGDVVPHTAKEVEDAFLKNRAQPDAHPRAKDEPVIETSVVEKSITAEGYVWVNQYIVLKTLGRGAYSKVKLCVDTTTGHNYAMKICSKSDLRRKLKMGMNGGTHLDDVRREISIMKHLCHKNIVTMHEVIDSPNSDKLYIVLEHAPRGALMKSVVRQEPLDLNKARRHFRDIVEGLEYLHHMRVIHRDIKPENLFMGRSGKEYCIKIGDFGVSHVFAEGAEMLERTEGTPAFLAPEILTGGQYSGRGVDLWALGVTLYAFIFGTMPFMSEGEYQIYEEIKQAQLKFPFSVEASLVDLLERLMCKDPARRITIPEIKVHPWVTMNGVWAMPEVTQSDPPIDLAQVYQPPKIEKRPYPAEFGSPLALNGEPLPWERDNRAMPSPSFAGAMRHPASSDEEEEAFDDGACPYPPDVFGDEPERPEPVAYPHYDLSASAEHDDARGGHSPDDADARARAPHLPEHPAEMGAMPPAKAASTTTAASEPSSTGTPPLPADQTTHGAVK